MVAKTHAVPDTDEDIIELTDIIEQGTPPEPAASAVPADDDLSDLMSADAGAKPGEESEDDLDALLAEIGAVPQATTSAASQADQSSVNPDETLDMPDMREVENLLGELNIPTQPPVAAGVAATLQNAGHLDEVLDQLRASPTAALDAPTASSDPTDELDELLNSITANPAASASPTASIEDLDALLDSVTAAPATSTPPTAPTEDMDALLDNVASPVSVPAPAAKKTKSPITISVSVSPPMPAAAPVTPQLPETAAAAEDLDALLESTPSASPETEPDEPLPPLTEQAATQPTAEDAAENAPDAVAAASAPAPVASGVAHKAAGAAAMPPLPRQWDDLLGSSAESQPAALPAQDASVAAPVPQDILERLERMEQQFMELTASAATEGDVSATLNATLEKMAERLEGLEARLTKMESNAKADLERAAAVAAARILREELAAILSEGTG